MAELEITDPVIKLFGQTIALPLNHVHENSGCTFVSSQVPVLHQKVTSCEGFVSEKQGNESAKQITDQTTSEISENPSIEKQISFPNDTRIEEQSETSMSPDNKTSKKPDKILPCPRCNSMDTKFCYYNNYNVNQPRHFCKNCQRYWTAGGTMRNVPVGAGRRKNKTSSSSHFRQLIIPDTGIHQYHHQFLTFAPNGDDHSSKSSITASNSPENGNKITSQKSAQENSLPFLPQLQSYNGFPWPFFPAGIPLYCPVPPYWGCTAPPPLSSWTVTNPNGQDSSTNSSVLGKHFRDGEEQKTLKMSDPIWSTIGTQKEKASASSINGSGHFGCFKQTSKGTDEENETESWSLLQANPAALSRALKFREIV